MIPCHSFYWHYCPTNTPVWSFVRRADTDTFVAGGGVGYIWACRPSIVQQSATAYLYAVWEEFDSIPNIEPTTNFNRANIWVAESRDNGLTWPIVKRVTTPNTTSKRFPCAAGVANDTLYITYMIDSIAGFSIQAQGRATRNPIVMLHIPVPFSLTETKEAKPTKQYYNFSLSSAFPNPFALQTTIHYSVPQKSNVVLELYDVTGSLIKTLVSETKPAGEYAVYWNGTSNNGERVKAGVYFYTLKTNTKSMTRKTIKL